MLLTKPQIITLLDRLTWEPLYEDDRVALCAKRRSGYSNDPKIAAIEAWLSIMLQVAVEKEKNDARKV